MIYAPVTLKVLSNVQYFYQLHVNIWFGFCSIVCLLMKMLHLAQHFESDGGLNHCNFLLPGSNFKIFSENISRLMWPFSNTNLSRANSKKIPFHQLEGKLFSRVQTIIVEFVILSQPNQTKMQCAADVFNMMK